MFKKKRPVDPVALIPEDRVQSLLKKVRQIEIKSRRLTTQLFTGEYHTAFRGQGMAFKEVKEYQPGDDVRFIDWNVSARMGHAYTKFFEEERERSLFLMIDMSASTLFGTRTQNKKDMITEMAAVLCFAAVNNNDKAGLLFFTDKVEKYIPPKKGKDHALTIVREMVNAQPHSTHTDVSTALHYLNNVTKHKSIVFLLSDFADAGYHKSLQIAAKRHDVTGIQVYDPADAQLPEVGLIRVQDAETGKTCLLKTSDTENRNFYHQQHRRIRDEASMYFKQCGASLIQIGTDEDYVLALRNFFLQHHKH